MSKFRKRILPSLVYVLHKTRKYAFSRRSRAVTAKKCTENICARAKLLFWLNLFLFLRCRCRRHRQILSSLLCLIRKDTSYNVFYRFQCLNYILSPQTTLEANVKRKIRDLMTENNAFTPAFFILGFFSVKSLH